MPVFPDFGLFCLFLDKVNQKKRSSGRKYIEDGSKHTCTHMSSHKVSLCMFSKYLALRNVDETLLKREKCI